MQVYDHQIRLRTIELLTQNLNLFNASSGGTIVLSDSAWEGNYTRESFYNSIAGAQRRVNRYNDNSYQSATSLTEAEKVAVKVAGGFGPVLFEPGQLTWLQSNPAEAINVIAQGFADALLSDQLNTVISCGVAALSHLVAATNDVSATSGVTQQVLNKGHALFGDASQMLMADVMTGQAYHNLIDKSLANGEQLFQSGNVTVVSILGKRIVVTDAPALYESGSPNKTKVLSLTSNALIVDNASDIITNMQTTNGKRRIETTWQADYTFGVGVKGYAWDIHNGGKSPDDDTLQTGSNWDLVHPLKRSAGIITIADADS